jgi:hypothetical protein
MHLGHSELKFVSRCKNRAKKQTTHALTGSPVGNVRDCLEHCFLIVIFIATRVFYLFDLSAISFLHSIPEIPI